MIGAVGCVVTSIVIVIAEVLELLRSHVGTGFRYENDYDKETTKEGMQPQRKNNHYGCAPRTRGNKRKIEVFGYE